MFFSFKIGVLKNSANFAGKDKCWSVFNKVAGLTLLKDTPTQVFSCEFYEIFKNTLFKRTPPVASSAQMLDKVLITPQFTDVIYESN